MGKRKRGEKAGTVKTSPYSGNTEEQPAQGRTRYDDIDLSQLSGVRREIAETAIAVPDEIKAVCAPLIAHYLGRHDFLGNRANLDALREETQYQDLLRMTRQNQEDGDEEDADADQEVIEQISALAAWNRTCESSDHRSTTNQIFHCLRIEMEDGEEGLNETFDSFYFDYMNSGM